MSGSSNQPKVALVTGSGRKRVGNVVARSLAEQGFRILYENRKIKSSLIPQKQRFVVGNKLGKQGDGKACEKDPEGP